MNGPWSLVPGAVDDCAGLLRALLDSTELRPGTVNGDGSVRPDIRRSAVGWPDPARHAAELARVRRAVLAANRELWGFDLDGGEEWQLTHYTHLDAGVYERHMDCSLEGGRPRCRKVSVSVNLSDPRDYEGGSLRLGAVGQPDREALRQRGAALVFPSFVEHRVTPLLAGERYSLVAWFSGPAWR